MNLKISSSPHVRSKDTTSDIMFDVLVALMPALGFGLYLHGWYAMLLVVVCIGSCVGFEALYQKKMHKKITVGDYSAAVTGLLLALNLPPKLPIWMAIVGSAFAIIVVKQLFGGLGQNFMNPALGARCFLLLAFSRYMTNFVYDGVSTATPLTILKSGGEVSVRDMFFGYTAGTIGETSAIALLVGAGYLLIRRVISPKIPLVYIGTFAACIAIYGVTKNYDVLEYTAAHVCGGGLMLGAWFMATDYVTSPITSTGKVIYAVLLGLLTFVLRIFGGSAEGVSYAIIISNLLVPLIESVTAPKAFGAGAKPIGAVEDSNDHKQKKNETSDTETEASDEKNGEASSEETEKNPKKKPDIKGVVIAIVAIGVITIVMGAALGAVHDITKEPIAEAEAKAKEDAYKEVFADAATIEVFADDNISIDQVNEAINKRGFTDVYVDELNVAKNESDEALGLIFLVTNSSGYGGDLQMAVGVTIEKRICGVKFLKISETAGLGMEAQKPEFLEQFIDKPVGVFTYTKTGSTSDSEIDALSGATITTSAVVDTINAVLSCIKGGY